MSRIGRRVCSFLIAWGTLAAVVLAQSEELSESEAAAESAKGPVWAIGYIVVILLVALGVFTTVLSSKRRDRERPQE